MKKLSSHFPFISKKFLLPWRPITTSDTNLNAHFARVFAETSVHSWNSIIKDLARNGDPVEALAAYRSMRSNSLPRPDRSTFPCAIKSCSSLCALGTGKQLHLHAFASGLQPDLFVESSLIAMYSKCNQIGDGRKVFDETSGKNAVVWTSMLAGCAQSDASRIGILYFKRLLGLKGGVDLVDAVMASVALTSCARFEEKHVTNSFHGLFVKIGVEFDVNVRNTLMDAYAKTGNLGFSRMMFDEMKERDVVSWNTILAVYGQNGFRRKLWDNLLRRLSYFDEIYCQDREQREKEYGIIYKLKCKLS